MIFSLLNNLNTFSSKNIRENLNLYNKSEEKEDIHPIGLKIVMNQQAPIVEDNLVLLCNGEIYNSADLFHLLGLTPKTDSSCEVILPLYKKYGMEYTLQLLDGVFSFLLLDNNVETDNFKLYVARDPYGVKPLYILNPIETSTLGSPHSEDEHIIGFSSEKQILYEFYKTLLLNDRNTTMKVNYELKPFLPGTYSSFILPSRVFSSWNVKKENVRYYQHGFNSIMYSESPQYGPPTIVKNIQIYLIRALEKRCQLHEGKRFLILLEEGDLGGSILAGLVKQYCVIHQVPWPETYSIRIAGEPKDDKAQRVADHLGLKHTDFTILQEDWDKELFRQKKESECYFNLRCCLSSMKRYISLSCWAQHLGEEDPSVVFMGKGAQELFGHWVASSDPITYDFHFKKQWASLYLEDESNMALEKNKIPFCVPFMDPSFVNYYMSLPLQTRWYKSLRDIDPRVYANRSVTEGDSPILQTRYHGSQMKDELGEQCSPNHLGMAFSPEYYTNTEGGVFLPEEIIPLPQIIPPNI